MSTDSAGKKLLDHHTLQTHCFHCFIHYQENNTRKTTNTSGN